MKTTLIPLLSTLAGLFRSRARLQLEVLALRQQLAMVTHRDQRRFHIRRRERLFWVWLYRLWPDCVDTLRIFEPDTLVRWHRRGFRLHWRWKSRHRKGGRPPASLGVRQLIRRISEDNPLWGAPRVHGELLMLGIEVSQATVAKYMIRHHTPPSQTWRTFLRNQAPGLACVDLFTVPTVTFRILYVLGVLRHERRQVIHFNVTEHPTSQWSGQQMVEAFPWDEAPRFLLRDRDSVYRAEFRGRVPSLAIEEVLTAPRSPWQNPYVERLIGSIRRECLNHVIVYNDKPSQAAPALLRRLLPNSTNSSRPGQAVPTATARQTTQPGIHHCFSAPRRSSSRVSASRLTLRETSRPLFHSSVGFPSADPCALRSSTGSPYGF